MTFSFQFASNPQTSNNTTGNDKINKAKKDQESRRTKLLNDLNEYREIYATSKKDFTEAQSVFLIQQRELAKHDKNEDDYEKYEKEYKNSKKAFRNARSDRDLKLQLLQYRTDNYVRANRTNLLDLA